MKKQRLKKAIVIIIGAVFLINAAVMSVTSNMNMGLVFTFVLGLVLLVFGLLPQPTVERIPKWIKGMFFGGIGVLLCFVVFLLGFGLNDTVRGDEDAIVVLGSGIRGEMLTVGLKNRLDEAAECYRQNNDALIVVSGGQGPQEDITEALAMERYLLSLGIPQEKILKEENATSTYENFLYSKEILDNTLGKNYKVCFVTNEYHVFRAGILAGNAGVANTTHSHSSTAVYTVLPSCFRECMAVVKMVLSGK